MTEKERLKEIINEVARSYGGLTVDELADHLLANGVIVPPCKVGDTIYRAGDPIKKVYEWQIEHIEIYADEIVFIDDSDNTFTAEDIGETVFLTQEEAEKALAERSEE